VLIDGRPLAAYLRAYLAGGRVFVPVVPVLTLLADRLWIDGDTLVAERDGRRIRLRIAPPLSGDLSGAYVPAGAALRGLGVSVRYDASAHRLVVVAPARAAVASPTPFNSVAPSIPPSTVFTPMPAMTPRPAWSGSPAPRRTALPFPPP
jgi:hypothetical protein